MAGQVITVRYHLSGQVSCRSPDAIVCIRRPAHYEGHAPWLHTRWLG